MWTKPLPVLLLLAFAPAPAWAGPAACDEPVEVDRFQYLRQLTLDLFQRVPTEAELQALADVPELPPATLDAMLHSDELRELIRRHHFDLLWPNIENAQLVNPALAFLLPAMFYEASGDGQRLFTLYVGLYQRGGLVPCKDEPAEFDDSGEPVLEPWPDGTMRDGWVMVEPYWAPGEQVKVCALEARVAATSESGQLCATAVGMFSGTCGCGPSLERCLSIEGSETIRLSLQEQFLRMVERPIREGRSYYDMLFGRDEELNGPLVHYYRHLVPMAVDPIIFTPPVPAALLPSDVPYTDMDWQVYKRSPEHSGLLTNLLFLLRFQTGRSRANRFYDAFLCQPFQAPELQLPSPSDPCSSEPDLRQRCGCNWCHAALEPASAYWGRFAEAGSMFLAPNFFPQYRADCATCAASGADCDFVCERFYLTEAGHEKEKPYVGQLLPYVFRDKYQGELDAMVAGPQALAKQALVQGKLQQCTTLRLFERLNGRPMNDVEQAELLPDLVAIFEESGFDFLALLHAMVTDPAYRRMAR